MSIASRALGTVARANLETRFAATLARAAGPAAVRVPPHKVVGLARDINAYGPAGAALSLGLGLCPDRPAIIDEHGSITFAELEARSNALANALRDLGFGGRDALGILARNHRGFYEALFAGARLGARTILLNTDFAGPQLADVAAREGVRFLVHDAEFSAACAAFDAPLGRAISWTDNGESMAGTVGALIASSSPRRPRRPAHRRWGSPRGEGRSPRGRVVLLTSGTTGTPKGAPRDMALSLAIPGGYLSKIPLRAGRTVVLNAPAFHAWGLLSSVLSIGLGNTLVVSRRFDPVATLTAIQRYSADTLITVPILLSRLLDVGPSVLSSYDLSSLRVLGVSGSALPAELATRAMDALGDVVYNLYGSTEVAYATIATPQDLRAAPGTVGRAPYGTTVRLYDADDRPVGPGEQGRIFVGNSIQFEGYTGGGTKAQVDGLMSTGDIGHFDADGRLFVDGRDDDMIISGGENVFPAEIEHQLLEHPAVVEAAVIGLPDPAFGSRLVAYVVTSGPVGVDELKDYVRSNLARYKVPREIRFLETMPRNPAGKIVKRDLPK